jgi:hypothetical protein
MFMNLGQRQDPGGPHVFSETHRSVPAAVASRLGYGLSIGRPRKAFPASSRVTTRTRYGFSMRRSGRRSCCSPETCARNSESPRATTIGWRDTASSLRQGAGGGCLGRACGCSRPRMSPGSVLRYGSGGEGDGEGSVASDYLGDDEAILGQFDSRAAAPVPPCLKAVIAGLCPLVATCAGNGKILIDSL